ncbi:MAG: hypothetical protein VZT48_09155 [Bulleidia sp.]|nr:hypothetical protein [Bulleidia sp.]
MKEVNVSSAYGSGLSNNAEDGFVITNTLKQVPAGDTPYTADSFSLLKRITTLRISTAAAVCAGKMLRK